MILACDWDHTLYADDDWLPGAKQALKALKRRGHTVIVHSCRASYPAGEQFIRDTLKVAGFGFDVTAVKPTADVYLDDRALRFEGDWTATLNQLRSTGTFTHSR